MCHSPRILSTLGRNPRFFCSKFLPDWFFWVRSQPDGVHLAQEVCNRGVCRGWDLLPLQCRCTQCTSTSWQGHSHKFVLFPRVFFFYVGVCTGWKIQKKTPKWPTLGVTVTFGPWTWFFPKYSVINGFLIVKIGQKCMKRYMVHGTSQILLYALSRPYFGLLPFS